MLKREFMKRYLQTWMKTHHFGHRILQKTEENQQKMIELFTWPIEQLRTPYKVQKKLSIFTDDEQHLFSMVLSICASLLLIRVRCAEQPNTVETDYFWFKKTAQLSEDRKHFLKENIISRLYKETGQKPFVEENLSWEDVNVGNIQFFGSSPEFMNYSEFLKKVNEKHIAKLIQQ